MKHFQSLIISLFLSSFIFSQVSMSIDNVTENSLSVIMDNSVDVGGFQFDLTGVTVNDASGGSAGSNGFLISTSSSTILGFSLTGSTKSPGLGLTLSIFTKNRAIERINKLIDKLS